MAIPCRTRLHVGRVDLSFCARAVAQWLCEMLVQAWRSNVGLSKFATWTQAIAARRPRREAT